MSAADRQTEAVRLYREGVSLQEIGKRIGSVKDRSAPVTRERARQIVHRALRQERRQAVERFEAKGFSSGDALDLAYRAVDGCKPFLVEAGGVQWIEHARSKTAAARKVEKWARRMLGSSGVLPVYEVRPKLPWPPPLPEQLCHPEVTR